MQMNQPISIFSMSLLELTNQSEHRRAHFVSITLNLKQTHTLVLEHVLVSFSFLRVYGYLYAYVMTPLVVRIFWGQTFGLANFFTIKYYLKVIEQIEPYGTLHKRYLLSDL